MDNEQLPDTKKYDVLKISQLDKGKALLLGGGLSNNIVKEVQSVNGFNELASSKPKKINQLLIEVLKEPMVYLLLGCGGVYFFLGDLQESLMLLGFLVLILIITVFEEHKAEHALEALKDLSSPRALVLREGNKLRISGKEVVVGDIIYLNEGDRISADSMLLISNNLFCDDSLLTGESLPVQKKEQENIYTGSTVVSGSGVAIVTAIGMQTALGRIGKSLIPLKKESTKLIKQTDRLVHYLVIAAVFLSLLVSIIYSFNQHNWTKGILAGITLAMAILPNELPAVLTIFLALGAWRISKRRVLTRKLPAIENLGAASVLCVDKTGTLTLNQMTIQSFYAQEKFIEIENSETQFLPEEFHEVLEFGILASQVDPYDPMEKAMIVAGNKYLSHTEHLHQDWIFEKEYPLSPELLSISHAWKALEGGEYVVGAKGAPEAIIDLCHLDDFTKNKIEIVILKMASKGLRVLGVARAKRREAESLPGIQHDFDFKFCGLIGITDPVRAEVPAAIKECQQAGIRIIMITGDHHTTATSIALKIGLKNAQKVLTGNDLRELTDNQLLIQLPNVNIYSRVSPEQKLRLVRLLKSTGEVVAMTGDGVNDAPALKAADIGIAMGGRGCDVARESAALVLLDDDFGSIVESIRLGRRIYKNLQLAIGYLFAIHIPIAGLSIIPVFFNLPLVLLPAHIAFLHLIIEPSCSIAFEASHSNDNLMLESPRLKTASLFELKIWLTSVIQGLSIMLVLIATYYFILNQNRGEQVARGLVFSMLIVANIFLIFSKLGKKPGITSKLIAFFSCFLVIVVFWLSSLRSLFSFSSLLPFDFFIAVVLGAFSVLWWELWLKLKLKLTGILVAK